MNAPRLDRIVLVSAEPDRLAAFYEAAFGFERLGEETFTGERAEQLFGGDVRSARTVAIRLGEQRVDLVSPKPLGAPYPADVPGWSLLFQHFAIIVSDMATAFERLSETRDWTPISRDGPQTLPASSGGVTAFKFRDPEGHPLELLAFPPGAAPEPWRRSSIAGAGLGIDHSAISVADTSRSIRFYENLGLRVSQTSHNLGDEQARLDGLDAPDVLVTGLTYPDQAAPHVELLCYRGDFPRTTTGAALNDIAATRLVFALDEDGHAAASRDHAAAFVSEGLMRDPDGHLVMLDPVARR